MKFEINVTITGQDGTAHTENIVTLTKASDTIGGIGLSIAESKQLLLKLQQEIVSAQCAAFCTKHACCRAAGESCVAKRATISGIALFSATLRSRARDFIAAHVTTAPPRPAVR